MVAGQDQELSQGQRRLTRQTTTLPLLIEDYCGRSIVALRILVDKPFRSSLHNGVVRRHVVCNPPSPASITL